jgi:hypothetical protein
LREALGNSVSVSLEKLDVCVDVLTSRAMLLATTFTVSTSLLTSSVTGSVVVAPAVTVARSSGREKPDSVNRTTYAPGRIANRR